MNSWRKCIAAVLVLVMIISMTACGGDDDGPTNDTETGDYPEMELTMTAQGQETGGINITSRYMMDLVTERSGGKITFKEYWNGTLAAGTDTLKTVGEGVADCADIVTLYTVSELPLAQIAYCVPFASEDPETEAKLMTKMWEAHPEFVEEYEQNGVHPLFIKGIENYDLQLANKLDEGDISLDMFKGKKVTCGGVYYHYWFDALGSTFVSGTAASVYNDLNNNLIQFNMSYPSLICDFKTYEVSETYLQCGLGARACHIWGINTDTWNSFNDATKELFQECAEEAQSMYYQWLSDSTDSWMEEIEASNNIITMPVEMREDWAAAALDYFDTLQLWIDTVNDLGYDGEALMSDYLKFGEELGIQYKFDTSTYIK